MLDQLASDGGQATIIASCNKDDGVMVYLSHLEAAESSFRFPGQGP